MVKGLLRYRTEAGLVKQQHHLERSLLCDSLPWLESGWPSNTFTRPTPSQAAEPPKRIPFRAKALKLIFTKSIFRGCLLLESKALAGGDCGF